MDEKKLVTEGSIYMTLDSAANAGLGGIFWIAVAKIAAPDIVGRANIVVALTSLLVIFAGFGFSLGASKFISEYNSKGLEKLSRLVYSKTIRVTLVSSLIIALGLFLASAYLANGVYQDQQLTLLIALGALSIPFQALVRSLNGVYQGCQRMAFCLIGDSTFLVLRLVIAVVLVIWGLGSMGIVVGYTAGFVASAAVGLLFLAPAALPRSTGVESLKLTGSLFRFSAPNYFATIFNTGANQISILLVGLFMGPAAAAYYNIALLTRLVLATLALSIGLALMPTVSSIVSKARKDAVGPLYNASVRSAILLVAGPILILYLIPDQVLGLISQEYSSASLALQILVLSSLGSVIFGVATSALNGLNRPISALLATGLGASIGTAATVVLIPVWGLPGAASGILINGILSATISIALLYGLGGVRTEFGTVAKPLFSLGSSIGLGELALLAGLETYVAVALAVSALLGILLLLKVTTLSELYSILRLALEKVGFARLSRLARKTNEGGGTRPRENPP